MSNLARILAVVLMAVAIAGCATTPVSSTSPVPPQIRGCNICRWVDINGIVSFSECRMPAGTAVAGWYPSGGCTYTQSAPRNP
jgi:hypothetical protein